jgi:hypothetical protein
VSRYAKALTALAADMVEAAALLPTDAPPWLLLLGVAAQTSAVYAVPNRPKR